MKKTILLSLSILVFCLNINTYGQKFSKDGIHYSLNSRSAVTVIGVDRSILTYADIPEQVTYNNISYKVTRIGKNAFEGPTEVSKRTLNQIFLPSTIEVIEEKAFYRCEASSIVLSEGLKDIGARAFMLSEISSIVIPYSCEILGGQCFRNTPLMSISVPKKFQCNSIESMKAYWGLEGRSLVFKFYEEEKSQIKADPKNIASQQSDVDKNIPKTNVKNENTFAFIIANQNYKNAIEVPFALNDGRVFKEYCSQTLGIDERHINLYEDATMGDFYNCIDKMKKVSEIYEDASIIFYYAGHAFPDEKTKASYLLPIDGNGKTTAVAYSLNNLYKELSSVKTKNVLCFIDACFSGATRDGEVLVAGRGVAIKPKEETPLGNIIVFSSATGAETAHQYEQQQHGLFTYFLLKKLQESKGNITLGELSKYIIDNVKRTSYEVNNKPQTPTVIPSQALQDKWQKIKL